MEQDVKPRKAWQIVLVVSLALNLLFVGLVGGAFLRGGGAPPRGFDLQLGPLSDALSRADRRKISDQIRRDIGRSGLSRNERRVAFEALVSAVEAQPFDPELLTRLIEDQQSRTTNLRTTALSAFVGHLTEMTAQERQTFAQIIKRQRKRVIRGHAPQI